MIILLELAGKFSTMDARKVSLADNSTDWLDCGLTFKISSPVELDEPLPPLLELENDNDETGLPVPGLSGGAVTVLSSLDELDDDGRTGLTGLSGVPGVVVIVPSPLDELENVGVSVWQEYVALALVGLEHPLALQA